MPEPQLAQTKPKPKPKLVDPPQKQDGPNKDSKKDANGLKTGDFLGFSLTIVPEGHKGPLPKGPWIKEREIPKWQKIYQKIESGSAVFQIYEEPGSLFVVEDEQQKPYKDPDKPNSRALIKPSNEAKNNRHLGRKKMKHERERPKQRKEEYPGFKKKVLKMFKKLLTGPSGRKLIEGLMTGGQTVQIRPRIVDGNAYNIDDGRQKRKEPTGSVIFLHPNMSDKSHVGKDITGKKTVTFPAFIILGHELIHANHNKLGANKGDAKVPGDTKNKHTDQEEKNTIVGPSPGGVTENDLRRDHNLELRPYHRNMTKIRQHYTPTVEGNKQGG